VARNRSASAVLMVVAAVHSLSCPLAAFIPRVPDDPLTRTVISSRPPPPFPPPLPPTEHTGFTKLLRNLWSTGVVVRSEYFLGHGVKNFAIFFLFLLLCIHSIASFEQSVSNARMMERSFQLSLMFLSQPLNGFRLNLILGIPLCKLPGEFCCVRIAEMSAIPTLHEGEMELTNIFRNFSIYCLFICFFIFCDFKMAVFWVVAPCSLVEVCRHFALMMGAASTSETSSYRCENLRSYL
jgi:hypothetical protein